MNRLFNSKLKHVNLLLFNIKKYSSVNCIYKQEFTVSPFCNIFIKCPFNLKIRPIDIHQHPHCDKLFIQVFSKNPKTDSNDLNITCKQENKIKFDIVGETNEKELLDCFIEIPVKADINAVATGKAKIDVKKLNGAKIILQSDSGDIISENCQTSKIYFKSLEGNVATLGTLHAGEIKIETKDNANIDINHLQALKASVFTNNGDIKIKSSYCDNTFIKTNQGKLILDNIHKNCSIKIVEKGYLQMTGFDGTLNANITEADLDIQVSKLYDTSKINVKRKCSILLRLSEWIQDNTLIKTNCQLLKVADDVILTIRNKDNCAILAPKHTKYTSELEINTNLSNVNIEAASWSDMLKMKGIKFTD